MPVELPYVGEVVTKRLIEENVPHFLEAAGLGCSSDESVSAVYRGARLAPLDGATFDGASTIDLLIYTSARAIPVEVKLGICRLGSNRFINDFLRPCERSKHKTPRWNGNVIGFLERRFPRLTQAHPLKAMLNGDAVALTKDWILVVRGKVALALEQSRDENSLRHAHIMAFEDLVELRGGRESFNQAVGDLLHFDYYNRWLKEEARTRRD